MVAERKKIRQDPEKVSGAVDAQEAHGCSAGATPDVQGRKPTFDGFGTNDQHNDHG